MGVDSGNDAGLHVIWIGIRGGIRITAQHPPSAISDSQAATADVVRPALCTAAALAARRQ